MRADRLLSLLMLLQTRGRQTARRLAEALEVSERTIYRDLEALSTAGVPVYAERGPGGGVALLESYRTTLTGLNEGEVQALFMLTIPTALAELGVSGELKAALLKLAAALPASRREAEQRVRRRIYLDATPWSHTSSDQPHLQVIYRAVWEDRRLAVTFQPRFGTSFTRTVDAYALVAKGDIWYLVALQDGRPRVFPLAGILAAGVGEDRFERQPDFDLVAFWEAWCAAASERPAYRVTIRAAPELLFYLPQFFGEGLRRQVEQAGPPDAEGWQKLELSFVSIHAARERLLGFGRAVEVLAPKALRLSLADYARQIAALYD
jgi:predicted DNA-binding transcriptional regulator YafY